MTALTLGLIIALHGFAGQIILSGGSGAVSSGGGGGGSSMTFTTDSARVTELRGYGGAMFPRKNPFGLENSQVIDSSSLLIEPYGDVPGANGELVDTRDDSIPEDEDQLCDFCPSS